MVQNSRDYERYINDHVAEVTFDNREDGTVMIPQSPKNRSLKRATSATQKKVMTLNTDVFANKKLNK